MRLSVAEQIDVICLETEEDRSLYKNLRAAGADHGLAMRLVGIANETPHLRCHS